MPRKKKVATEVKETKQVPDANVVCTVEQLNALIAKVKKAQIEYSNYSQEQVDKIFKAAATAANKVRIPLARMAVEDTGMGVLEDKIIKNHFAPNIFITNINLLKPAEL